MVHATLKLLRIGAIFVLATTPLFADRITLNSGEEIEGTIISENESEVVIEHAVTNKIIDQRSIPRSDIKTVFKVPTDAIEFAKIKGFKPGPNSTTVAAYDAQIGQLYRFIFKNKESEHLTEVRANIEALKLEKERVAKGDLKWNNRWYTPKEAEAEKYQVGGFKLYSMMREQAMRGDYVGALNSFDRLEKSYPGCRSFPDAVELAVTVIQHLNNEIDRVIPLVKLKQQQFEEGVVILKEPDKSQTIAARKAEIANAEVAMAAASKSGIKWPPLVPIISKSTDALRTISTAELERLRKLTVANMRSSITAAETAAKEVEARNLPTAEEKLAEARTLWANNELLAKLDPAVKTLKTEVEAAAKKAAAEAAEAEKAAKAASGKKSKTTAKKE